MSLLTEAEAKEKRCCADAGAYCSASLCMAWRWQPQASMSNPSAIPGHGQQTIKRVLGYCGLAGRPT